MRSTLLRATCALVPLVATALPVVAQVPLVPSDRAPYRQKFDLEVPDARYLFVPQGGDLGGAGVVRFHFRHPALDSVLAEAAAVHYVTVGEDGVRLQVLNLRPATVPPDALGPQRFEVVDTAGAVLGGGTMLVVGRTPEAAGLSVVGGARVVEVGRPAEVELRIRGNGNLRGGARVTSRRDFVLEDVRVEEPDSAGVTVVRGTLRALRADASELKVAVETADGRVVELPFTGLNVRAPVPKRVQVAGGPLFLDALGRGGAALTLSGFEAPVDAEAEVSADSPELTFVPVEAGGDGRSLAVRAEYVARTPRAAGSREVREVVVRAGDRVYRGWVEVVAGPTIASARTGSDARAVLRVGTPVTLRVTGQNLDELRVDCAPLGPDARCRTLSSGPAEVVQEIVAGAATPEGEILLPLVAGERRAAAAGEGLPGLAVRVVVERPSVPVALAASGLVRVTCGNDPCRAIPGDSAFVARPGEASRLRLALDEARLPAGKGWQRLQITVTRIRGDQRQVVRTIGTASAPKLVRAGGGSGSIALLDASVDTRHGDVLVVRVEHVADQYPLESRALPVVNEASVTRVYVDAGLAKRIAGDIAVQPVLLSVASDGDVTPLYPNAGLGVTWQFLNRHLEASPFSVRLQVLATNLRASDTEGETGRPALLLSANLRVPGTDPGKPLVLSAGGAHLFGDATPWRLLVGASMDLGVARLIFGG